MPLPRYLEARGLKNARSADFLTVSFGGIGQSHHGPGRDRSGGSKHKNLALFTKAQGITPCH
jgi:hypothetical protein